jgi:branched-chain amino acid transport system ATP-binding protein
MSMTELLAISGLHSGYGRTEVLRGVDLRVGKGELVAIIGSNGAGKSTLLKSVIGLLRPSAGDVSLLGESILGISPEKLIRRGVALVPEGRLLFGPMTVRENLELGAYRTRLRRSTAIAQGLSRVFELFPILAERTSQRADTLSGGEQQMLAVGRALMSDPSLLLLDEPSLGLAPKVIAEIFSALDALRGDGMTILLVEQDARLALRRADRGYVMRTGRVVLEGAASVLLDDESVRTIYLGSVKGEGSA